MKTLTMLVMMLGLIALIGCGAAEETSTTDAAEQTAATETAETTETTETATADEAQTAAEEPVAEQPTTEVIATDEFTILDKEQGIRYAELVMGTGVEALDRMQVECHYTLFFADSTGLEKVERFQSSKDSNRPFQCQLGVRLIPGWSIGMIGMKEGGTRRIFVPWNLGYGPNGSGKIPPKTNLIFEIDFLKAL